MNKQDFLNELRNRSGHLPQSEIDERISFYNEMIDDYIEDGLTEEEAIRKIGSIDTILGQASNDNIGQAQRSNSRQKQRTPLTIVLLVLGSPIWFSLLISAFSVILSLYISLWAVIISLWAAFAALVGSASGSLLAGIGFSIGGHIATGIAMVGAGLVCAGLAIFLFYGCKAATKGAAYLMKGSAIWIKRCCTKRRTSHV